MDKLDDNGFKTQYFHPNTILISWNHWVPSYIRNELKKKTGIIIDENGNRVGEGENKTITNGDQPMSLEQMMFKNKDPSQANSAKAQNQKKYTPIASYKPQGNLVYNDDLLNTLGDKFS
jgi:hypothetical protein